MVVFNPLILQNWKLSGYKFIYVLPRNKYGVLRPLSEDRSVKRGYTIEIGELPLHYEQWCRVPKLLSPRNASREPVFALCRGIK